MVRNREKQCEGKKRHDSHAAAGRFLHWLRKRKKVEEAKLMHPYKCPHCGYWHLGHKPTDPVALHHADLVRLEDIRAEEGYAEWAAEQALCKKS